MIFANILRLGMKIVGTIFAQTKFREIYLDIRNFANNFVKIHEICKVIFAKMKQDIFVSALVNRYFRSFSFYPFVAGLKR